MLSYWEKSQMLHYDFTVVGGGITGLFCALSYRDKYPKATIAILERGLVSSGASTKNGGFACFGSLTELIDDSLKMDSDKLLDLVQLRIKGLECLRKTLGDSAIDYQPLGGHELFFDSQPKALESLDYFNKLLKPIFGKTVYSLNNKKIKDFGFSKNHISNLVENPFEGQINTGKMMNALRSKINRSDISFFSNAEVTNVESHKNYQDLVILLGDHTIKLKCHKLAICNNAFAKRFFPHIDINPGRGLVIVTKPIQNLKVKGCFHYNEGYYYFRNIDNRVMIGGGREQNIEMETTTEFGINGDIKKTLIEDLQKFILPIQKSTLEFEWSGIMAFGKNKRPIIKKHNENCAMGVRLGGMGISIGSMVGKKTAELLFDS